MATSLTWMRRAEPMRRLEERGLAVTASALRVAYAAGGDGELDARLDLRNAAAFVRDPDALVTCLLLPLSASLRLESQARAAPNPNFKLWSGFGGWLPVARRSVPGRARCIGLLLGASSPQYFCPLRPTM